MTADEFCSYFREDFKVKYFRENDRFKYFREDNGQRKESSRDEFKEKKQ